MYSPPQYTNHINSQLTRLHVFKGTVSRNFLLMVFHESVSPQPKSIPLGPFRMNDDISMYLLPGYSFISYSLIYTKWLKSCPCKLYKLSTAPMRITPKLQAQLSRSLHFFLIYNFLGAICKKCFFETFFKNVFFSSGFD
jgi:hypothetical protein